MVLQSFHVWVGPPILVWTTLYLSNISTKCYGSGDFSSWALYPYASVKSFLIRMCNNTGSLFWEVMINIWNNLNSNISFTSTRWSNNHCKTRLHTSTYSFNLCRCKWYWVLFRFAIWIRSSVWCRIWFRSYGDCFLVIWWFCWWEFESVWRVQRLMSLIFFICNFYLYSD